ncbi:hypothetical protein GCM10010329_14300 [Streptomyces spiroverticillatus]|uniref:Uncharacterized protein n=1 Tax=Streptomyces finlayi TaxID=67296 RepID=A0A918X2R8_9ACTN|nr:DUF6153 family protein [Streptomyces finlayi]GGZ94214.1 hypothetical protein GCM10010329_14300 [Streptomyces spiroverticillatus]GHD06641.1 hypothetical protein GCM10010334_58330 [Streptomyces finlayi]
MTARRGRGTWGGRLLLLTALLFGIVTMHTLGHPAQEHEDTASVTVSHQEAPAPPHAAHRKEAPASTLAPALASTLATTTEPPLHGMDPMSVCLAVLTVWNIALLCTLALSRRPQGWAEPVRDSGLLRSLWPHPPPLRVALARLSVLRI